MTSRTACQNVRSLDVVLRLPVQTFGDLSLCAISRSPFHVENFLFRSHKIFRTPMTLQTPFHLQRRGLRHDRHLIDSPVTGRATDAFVHMNRVIEVSEVGQVVNANPFQRLAALETCAHRFEIRAIRPDLFMAVHADRRRRHSGRCRNLNRCMTVTAIDAVITDVVLVAELDGLLSFDPLACVPA